MFFDWEYHEPKGYISHRFSKGDIAFVQNRYRGMEWTCMVGRKLDFPIEGVDMCILLATKEAVWKCERYMERLLTDIRDVETIIKRTGEITEKDGRIEGGELWIETKASTIAYRSIKDSTVFYRCSNLRKEKVWIGMNLNNFGRELSVSDRDFSMCKYKWVNELKTVASQCGREVNRLAKNLNILRKIQKVTS